MIKALLLAAGLGTRLRPLTYETPKCLVEINGQPLLGRWIEKLEDIECETIVINTHYLSNKVEEYLSAINKRNIILSHEEQLLGTARTLMRNKEIFRDGIGLIIHADNCTDFNLSKLIDAHNNRPKSCVMTMLTFNSNDPKSCGIVRTDEDGILKEFYEKVENPPGNRANAAIYAIDKRLIDSLENMKPEPIDFSNDVLPSMLGRVYTHHTMARFLDIGTPKSLHEAQSYWKSPEVKP